MAWLRNPQHRVFTTLIEDAKINTPVHWYDLELCIKTVLGISEWFRQSRGACDEVWGSFDEPTWTRGKHASSGRLQAIGEQTARRVLETMIEERNEMVEWANAAFSALAPRLNAQWRKWRISKINKEALRSKSKDIQAESSSKADAGGDGEVPAASTHPTIDLPSSKKPTNKRRKVVAEEESLPQGGWEIQPRALCHRNINVKLDDGLAEDRGAAHHVVVGIGAIVEKVVAWQDHVDIRCDHLSFELFVQVIRELDPTYDFEEVGLWYDVVANGTSRSIEIRDANDFQTAVGVLEFYSQFGEVDGKLFMTMRSRD
jgi:hypothetical protein